MHLPQDVYPSCKLGIYRIVGLFCGRTFPQTCSTKGRMAGINIGMG